MKKISIIILLSLFLNIIPISVFAKNNEENSDVNLTKHATSSILVEATTGEIIYKQNPNKISSVASLTKMMGLIIIFDFINKGGTTYDEIITVSSYAKSMGGTQLYLETGEKISVNDLIKGIIMVSANDAMVAMAERVSGTEEAFVKKMNLKAKELGLKNTHFVNCTGFDEENHYSTASDMVKIAMELVNNYPDVYKFSSVYESYVRENTPNKTWIANTNKLVRFYEGADGLKTGSTNDAGKCIAATAKRNGLRLIAISLGYKDVTTRNKETMDLLDYGFNQYEINMLYEKDKKVGTVNVDKVNEKIDLYAKEDIFILKKKIDESISYQYEIVLDNVNKKVILPILGLNMAMYSRRTLLKFYSDTFKTEYTDVAILKNDAVEFLAKENEYGTVLFYNKYFNLIPELEHINDNKILMYYIDPNGLTSKDVIAILNGKKIDYDNKFYENKTVYKVSDLK